jgi:tripartite-type tricarboxylate transporter receptor subunit TctC
MVEEATAMNFDRNAFVRGIVIAGVVAAAPAGIASAESSWKPAGPVNVVMHTKPGGTADIFIRTLAETLEPAIGQPIVVVNQPGGAGAAQMAMISQAEPDGLTLGVNTLSHFTGMLTNLEGVFSIDDFSWIAAAQVDPILLFSSADSEIKTIDDLVEKAKESGDGVINMGGFGPVGAMQNIGVSMFEESAGIKLNWVGFEATPDIITALLGGHVDVGVSNLGPTQPFFEAGRLTPLAVHGDHRLDTLPDVPTLDEAGYPVNTEWLQVRGIFGPKDMDPELQQQIADAFHAAMKSESYQAFARSVGVVDSWMGPEEYTAFVNEISAVADEHLTKLGLTN